MALNPEDFKRPKLDISAFSSLSNKGLPVSDRNASMLAGGQTLLSEASEEEYRQIKSDLLDPRSHEDFLLRQQKMRDDIVEGDRGVVPDILADDTVSDEIKMSVLDAQGNPVDPMPVDDLRLLVEQALVADSENETPHAADVRMDALDSVEQGILNYKRAVQSAMNSFDLEQGMLDTALDIGEVMLPYAEWIHFDRLLVDLNDGDAQTNMLGQQKEQLYETIRNAPIEHRPIMIQQLVDALKNNERVVLGANTMLTAETLERMLMNGEYSDFERYFDNVTSVLDALPIVGWGVKAAGKAIRGSKGKKALEEFSNMPETLADEAAEFKSQVPTDENLAREAQGFNPQAEPSAGDVFNNSPSKADENGFYTPDYVTKNRNSQLEAEANAFKGSDEPSVDTVFREALSESVRSDVSPISPSQVIGEANPDLARKLNQAAVADETGEVAKAAYGTNATEAVAKDMLGEPNLEGRPIKAKVNMDPVFMEDEQFRKLRQRTGNTILNEQEQIRVRKAEEARLKDVRGMELQNNTFGAALKDDGTVRFSGIYKPLDAGFRTVKGAMESARVAFRDYRMPPEALKIVGKVRGEWVDIDLKDLEATRLLNEKGATLPMPKEFAVKIDYDWSMRPEDLDLAKEALDTLTTSNGYISGMIQRLGGNFGGTKAQHGTLGQHLQDAASTIHPQIVNAASVAVDRTYKLKKAYVKEFEKFSDAFNVLPKDRRVAMTEYIQQANLEGIRFDATDLAKRGFNKTERNMLRQWRKANDLIWHALNEDMALSMRARGVRVFLHEASDTKLMGYPMKRGAVKKTSYDPDTGEIRVFTTEELDEIYNLGGEVIQLTEPVEVGGKSFSQVVSMNTPGKGYNRAIYEGERVMAYRDGYYPVMYDANLFLEKKIFEDGVALEKGRTIASARTTEEMNEYIAAIKKNDNLTDEKFKELYFEMRPDRAVTNTNNTLFEEGHWNMATSSGLTSQRIRGQRLQDASAINGKKMQGHLLDPLEAVARQVHQVSQRVSMRQYMDTAKKRWMIQYGPYLDFPAKAGEGTRVWPSDMNLITGKPGAPAKLVRDAKTNFAYLHYLENGYMNLIDDRWKAAANFAAEALANIPSVKLGPYELSAQRAAFGAAKWSPTQGARTLAFKLFISANPLRQAVIQRGQILMLGAHNPKYAVGQMQKDWWGVNTARYTKNKDHPYWKLWQELEESGIIDAVDGHMLIRDDLLRLADHTVGQRARTIANKPLEASQKYGFDLAEQDVLITAWLSARDKAIRKYGADGIKSQRVKDEILGEARSFTLNMNRAGDMPYSQNTLSIATQFFSFRHKAIIQGLTNRNLSPKQRASLLAYTTALFGMDAGIFYAMVDTLVGDDPSSEEDATKMVSKETLKNGLLDYTLNSALRMVTGTDTNIDWGDLAPVEAYGMGDIWMGMLTEGLDDFFITNTPAGSLLMGGNPRLADMYKTSFRYFHLRDDYENEELDTTWVDVSSAFMNLFSGASNSFKARYALETGQAMSGSGRITDPDVTKWEATAQMFGFRTRTAEGYRQVRELQFEGSSFSQDEFDVWYGELKRHLARRGETTTEDAETVVRVLQEGWRVFGEDRPRAYRMLSSALEKDAADADYRVITGILGDMGVVPEGDTWAEINKLPPGSARDTLTEAMKGVYGD